MGWWKFFDALPGWAWAMIAGFLLIALFGSTMKTGDLEKQLDKKRREHAEYVADVEKKQRIAVAHQREVELHNFRNSERVSYEQATREAALADDLARRSAAEQRVRNEFSAFRAAAARDAKSGNIAGLAAKAGTATELYEACRAEYRGMAEDAERVRIQAVGLWEYIRGNSMCSTPFGLDVPEPAK